MNRGEWQSRVSLHGEYNTQISPSINITPLVSQTKAKSDDDIMAYRLIQSTSQTGSVFFLIIYQVKSRWRVSLYGNKLLRQVAGTLYLHTEGSSASIYRRIYAKIYRMGYNLNEAETSF
ncbi:hypothetical protein Zmor_001468 [Zophobas morio]|uniref:Uncharacterized protein n=1 Tax=Zophobas morio TaxID=2755281 RepID=A0AA38MSU7_9CUCU|nr:hypothetical protein Zmor_026578 [Zophobas morio]KAJ3666008.1 hypothetical protein Zmor_001468 [Zophobas morio]